MTQTGLVLPKQFFCRMPITVESHLHISMTAASSLGPSLAMWLFVLLPGFFSLSPDSGFLALCIELLLICQATRFSVLTSTKEETKAVQDQSLSPVALFSVATLQPCHLLDNKDCSLPDHIQVIRQISLPMQPLVPFLLIIWMVICEAYMTMGTPQFIGY